MTEQEQINVNLDNRLTSLETKFEMFMDEMKQQREDIRRIQERQDAAQAKHDADMKEMNQRFYAKFDAMDAKIDSKFDKLSDQLHTMTIAAVVGFGAITVAVVGLVVSMLK
ncbi:MAG: hypothetical protein IJ685_11400 [Selenomonadaceae bacterium]|nr:hypothetical protein [Selenomonadaceae bacterium]